MSAPTTTDTTAPERGRGLGDRIRFWWNNLPRPQQWAIGVPAVIVIALLPVIKPPLISTTAVEIGRAHV